MEKKKRLIKIRDAQALLEQASKNLTDIVWEGQEGQKDHFDTLQKSEQVATIGLLGDLKNANNNLNMFLGWFDDKNIKDDLSLRDALKTVVRICLTPIMQRKNPDLYKAAKVIEERLGYIC